MANYVIIKNNVVENIIQAEQDFIDQHYPNAVLLQEGEVASIHWAVEDGKYIPPRDLTEEEIIAHQARAAERKALGETND